MVSLSQANIEAFHKQYQDERRPIKSLDHPRLVFQAREETARPAKNNDQFSDNLRGLAKKICTVNDIMTSKTRQWFDLKDEIGPELTDAEIKSKVKDFLQDENYQDPNFDLLENFLQKANQAKTHRSMQRFLAYYAVEHSKLIEILSIFQNVDLNTDFIAALKDKSFISRDKLFRHLYQTILYDTKRPQSQYNKILAKNLVEILGNDEKGSLRSLKNYLEEIIAQHSTKKNSFDGILDYVATLEENNDQANPDKRIEANAKALLSKLYEEYPNDFNGDDYSFASEHNVLEPLGIHNILESATQKNNELIQHHLNLIQEELVEELSKEEPVRGRINDLKKQYIDFKGEDSFKQFIERNLANIKHPSLLIEALLTLRNEGKALQCISDAAREGDLVPAASLAIAARREEFFTKVLKKFYLAQTNLKETLDKLVKIRLPDCLWEDEPIFYRKGEQAYYWRELSYNDVLKPILNQLELENKDQNTQTILEAINQYPIVKDLCQKNRTFTNRVLETNGRTLAA